MFRQFEILLLLWWLPRE